jgi:hypothetical protein
MRQTISSLWYCPGLLCVLLTGMAPLAAQTLYRCGNTYQDKPCSNGQQGKVVTILKGAEAKDGLLDVNCSQKGQDAQKIMWARESGMTEKEMLDKAKTASERELVMSVYRQRGSSAQIRQSVEAACIADKDRHAATGVPPAREGSMPGEGKSVAASTAAAVAASTSGKALCEKMRSEMGALLGKDGSKEQREAVASALKNAGCQGG